MIRAHLPQRRRIAATVAALFGMSAHPVAATTLEVTTCVDEIADVPGSLRYAVAHAHSGDEVNLSALPLSCSTITLAHGPIINYVDTITLYGPNDRTLTIDGAYADRVLIHNGTGTMMLAYLTVSRGYYDKGNYGGGCIYANGSVTLYHATVSRCFVESPATRGGGIYAHGDVTLKYGTVAANRAGIGRSGIGSNGDGNGAGVYVFGDFSAYQSTISDNSASGAAGGVHAHGAATLIASTLSGNSAAVRLAAIVNYAIGATLTVKNSTITGNSTSAPSAAAATIQFDHVVLYNSTVAVNAIGGYVTTTTIMAATVTAVSSIIASNQGHNHTDIVAPQLTGNSNIIGSASVALPGDTITQDPQLLPLAENGGPTPTLGLKATSPAINAGVNPLKFATDQRGPGFPRVEGVTPDIGAFEYHDDIFTNGFD